MSMTPPPKTPLATPPPKWRRHLGNIVLFSFVVGGSIVLLLLTADLTYILSPYSPEAAVRLHQALGSLAEVMAALLGLSLTVVAIVVQLASSRYPAKIVDLFMADPPNIAIFGFMTSSCIYVILAPAFISTQGDPVMLSIVGLALSVINLGLLLPYFGHVFAFLEPNNIITQIQSKAFSALAKLKNSSSLTPQEAHKTQAKVAVALESIADNAMAAVDQSDRNLSMHTIYTLEHFLGLYIPMKGELPKKEWSTVNPKYLSTLAKEFLDDIFANMTWVEAKVLMEYERVFRKALGEMNEVVSQIGSSTRGIGEVAIENKDWEVRGLVVQFFNTYLRHALNARNVRAAYNILYEYRRFASHLLRSDPHACVRIVKHLVYYGRTANAMNLPFVTVTVAHDVRILCEEAYDLETVDMGEILRLFLTLDQPSEDDGGDVALLGVRRAQSILGAFFLHREAIALAEQIRFDMRDEPPSRLRKIRDDILTVDERKFWEVTDRGFNFDWVPGEMRQHITTFFAPMIKEDKSQILL